MQQRTIASLLSVLALPLLAPACDESSSAGSDLQLDGGNVNVGTGDGGTACTPATGAGTHHDGDVKDGERWTAAGNPHFVDGDVNVRDGATLTIDPCVEVRFAAGAHLQVAFPLTPNTGQLVAEGTATQPITFTSNGAEPWGSLYVAAPGRVRLAYATFENGGGERFNDGATIVAAGNGELPADPVLFVDHVTIRKSRGTGAWLQRGAIFAPGSQELTVTESGGEGDERKPYALEISEHAIDTLPTGQYTGNAKDEILVRTEGDGGAASGLVTDATMHDRGVPYHLGDSESDSFTIGGAADGHVTTLTIEPGVVMKFEPKTAFNVQTFSTEKPSTAVLRALGTAEKPIVMTSAAAAPKAGDWRGLWFGGIPLAENKLDHVRIEYAGADCNCSTTSCSANFERTDAAVIFLQPPPSAFITNTTFKDIAGHGITEGWQGGFVNFRPTNTFDGVSGCPQTLPSPPLQNCQEPRPTCDGL